MAEQEVPARKQWVVASGIIESDDGILLVHNRRRDGRSAWSPPGGVVEVDAGESVLDGLTREVEEETGIRVRAWEGPLWQVEVSSPEWDLRVEVHRAVQFEGELRVEDPDGIVVDARFVPCEGCAEQLAAAWTPTTEPIAEWLVDRAAGRRYRYRVEPRVEGEPAPRVVRL